jgi:hypothetical protein
MTIATTGDYLSGDWYGHSPFDEGAFADSETPLRLPQRPGTSLVISEKGLLRYSKGGFVLLPFDNG